MSSSAIAPPGVGRPGTAPLGGRSAGPGEAVQRPPGGLVADVAVSGDRRLAIDRGAAIDGDHPQPAVQVIAFVVGDRGRLGPAQAAQTGRPVPAEGAVQLWVTQRGDLWLAQVAAAHREMEDLCQRLVVRGERGQDRLLDLLEDGAVAALATGPGDVVGEAPTVHRRL